MKKATSAIARTARRVWAVIKLAALGVWTFTSWVANAIEWLGKLAGAFVAISAATLIGWEILHALGYLPALPELPVLPSGIAHELQRLASQLLGPQRGGWPWERLADPGKP